MHWLYFARSVALVTAILVDSQPAATGSGIPKPPSGEISATSAAPTIEIRPAAPSDHPTRDLFLSLLPTLLTFGGGGWALYKYFRDKNETLNKTAEVALLEAQKPYNAKQQEIYFKLTEVTSLIATRIADPKDEIRLKAIQDFRALFWGSLHIVANENVSNAANAFSEALDQNQEKGFIPLQNVSMDLARACRRELGKAWNIDLEHYAKTGAMTVKELSREERKEIGKKVSGLWLAKNLLHLLGTGLEDTITVAEIHFEEDHFSYSGTNYTRRGEQCGQFTSVPVGLEPHKLSFLYDNTSSVTAHFARGITTINFPLSPNVPWNAYRATAKDSVLGVAITIQGYRTSPEQYKKLQSGRPKDEHDVIMQFINSCSSEPWN